MICLHSCNLSDFYYTATLQTAMAAFFSTTSLPSAAAICYGRAPLRHRHQTSLSLQATSQQRCRIVAQAEDQTVSCRSSSLRLHGGSCRQRAAGFAHNIWISYCMAVQGNGGSPHGDFDVSSTVVQPVFRSTPWDEEAKDAAAGGSGARILFVSESNVCRSVLAEATMRDLLEAHEMLDVVACESRGSKDYNVGDPPDATLQRVATELELRYVYAIVYAPCQHGSCDLSSTTSCRACRMARASVWVLELRCVVSCPCPEHHHMHERRNCRLPEGAAAKQFDHERDIVAFDLVLVMDKFCAADVLREVSDTSTVIIVPHVGVRFISGFAK